MDKKVQQDFIRLDKFLSNQCGLSRKQSAALLKRGAITVDGEVATTGERKFNPASSVVAVEGKAVSYRKYIYIMLNKPQGVVCATRDGLSPTVLSLLPQELQRKGLFPAGRLDKDTEGFVLITDDGELAHRMLSPKNHVPKVYYAKLEHPLTQSDVAAFAEGIVFKSGEHCLPAQLTILSEDGLEAEVVLREGMYHQVKRMFENCGNEVVYLKRIQLGGLKLDAALDLGECKEIVHKDVESLLETPI